MKHSENQIRARQKASLIDGSSEEQASGLEEKVVELRHSVKENTDYLKSNEQNIQECQDALKRANL